MSRQNFYAPPGQPPPGSIGNSELADMTAGTQKGRATGAGTGAPQDLTAIQQLVNWSAANAVIDDGNSGAADTIDFSAGPNHRSTLTGACTYTFTAPTSPGEVTLRLIQDGTGGRVVTWPAAVVGTPVYSLAASSTSLLKFLWDGTNYRYLATSSRAVSEAGEYIVNPGDAGAYQTIQTALNAGAAGSPTAYVTTMAAGLTYTENLTVGASKSATLRGEGRSHYNTVIDGTVTWNGASGSLNIENCSINGAISGAAVGTVNLNLLCVAVNSTITFTGSRVNITVNGTYGWGASDQGYLVGNISTTGSFIATDVALYNPDITVTGAFPIRFQNCWFQDTTTITTAGTEISLAACRLDAATVPSFVFSGSAGVVHADEFTLAQLLAAGSTITNGVWGGRNIVTAGAELTIASGVVTATHSRHAIDTEADGATDDLDTINGTVDGQLLYLYAADSGRTVVLKDGTGNMKLPGDVTLDNVEDVVVLLNRGGTLYSIAPVSNSGA